MKQIKTNQKNLLRSMAIGLLIGSVATANNAQAQSYCSPSFDGWKTITNTTFAGINYSNGGFLFGYQNFTSQTAAVEQGETVAISVTADNGGLDILVDAQYISVFIDYNNDGVFDPTEGTNLGTLSEFLGLGTGTVTGSIAIPPGVTLGSKRMRVVSSSGGYSTDGCGGSTGQAEDYTVNILAPVPITLASFTASINTQNKAQLDWITSAEKNNKGFEMQRSFDGKDFETIGFVAAQTSGNSSFELSYTFIDEQLHQGKVFYRLNQIDFDGTATLSDVVTVIGRENVAADFSISVYPNPAKDVIKIQTTGSTNGIVLAEVVDMTGRIVKQIELKNGLGNLEINGINNGMYYVVVKDATTSKMTKFMKQ